MATDRFAGPVDYLVFAFDESADPGAGLAAVLDRVQQGIIEILDVELIARGEDGAPITRSFADFETVTGVDPTAFAGAESGILDADDLAVIASELHAGQIALAVVYEDRSLATAAAAWDAVGGTELFSGGVDIADLEHVLDEGNRS